MIPGWYRILIPVGSSQCTIETAILTGSRPDGGDVNQTRLLCHCERIQDQRRQDADTDLDKASRLMEIPSASVFTILSLEGKRIPIALPGPFAKISVRCRCGRFFMISACTKTSNEPGSG